MEEPKNTLQNSTNIINTAHNPPITTTQISAQESSRQQQVQDLQEYQKYLRSVGMTETTIYMYSYYYQKFSNYLRQQQKNTDIDQIVYTFLERHKGGVPRGMLINLKEWHNIDFKIPRIRGTNKNIALTKKIHNKILTPEQVDLIAEQFETLRGPKYAAGILVLFQGGLRITEFIGIQKQDINFDTGQIVIIGKRTKIRTITISHDLAEILRIICAKKEPTERVWQYHKLFWQTTMAKVGLKLFNKRVSCHWLRHSCATWLRKQGMELQKVQIYLGHGSITTTVIYDKSIAEEKVHDEVKSLWDNKKENIY